jgi:hypothetical protein
MTATAPAPAPAVDLDAAISARLRSPDYRQWRAAVEATGGCAARSTCAAPPPSATATAHP